MLSSVIYSNFVSSERIRLVDSQIESYASLLSRADFIYRDFDILEEAEDEIQDILGGYRIDLVLIIKNYRGKVLYRNLNAKKLGIDPTVAYEWQFTEKDDTTLRLYTKKIPELGRVLQIGTVVSTRPAIATFFTRNHAFYFVLLFFVSALLAYVLTTRFFQPMKKLAEDLTVITKQLHAPQFSTSSWETTLSKLTGAFLYKNDEFVELTRSLQELLNQIKIAFEMNKNHSARLAHEVNTPLSLIKNRLQSLSATQDQEIIQEIHGDIDRLAEFVHRYLRFSETLNTPAQNTDIYAIKLETFIKQFEKNMSPIAAGRLKVAGDGAPVVFANHHDLEHLLQNLVTNALKYSPKDRDVILNFKEDEIIIQDFGVGIPQDVLNKLGSPFNFGTRSERATGLGLAWVQAIANKYDWKIDYQTTPLGTKISLHF